MIIVKKCSFADYNTAHSQATDTASATGG